MVLLSISDLRAKKGIVFSKCHLDRMIKEGRFPKPIWLGPRRRAWPEVEIDQWIDGKIAERDARSNHRYIVVT